MSQFVGVVTVPQRAQFAFRMIDFVPLDAQRVLVILVFTDNEVQNRIISTRRAYDRQRAGADAPTTSTTFRRPAAGRDPRHAAARTAGRAQRDGDACWRTPWRCPNRRCVPGSEDMLLAGQTRLMGLQDLSDMDRLRDLFEAFSRKREILQLLERMHQAPGVRVFIGEESGLAPLDGVPLVTAPYAPAGRCWACWG